MSNKMKC